MNKQKEIEQLEQRLSDNEGMKGQLSPTVYRLRVATYNTQIHSLRLLEAMQNNDKYRI